MIRGGHLPPTPRARSRLDDAQDRGFDPAGVMDPPTAAERRAWDALPDDDPWKVAVAEARARCCPDLHPDEHDVTCRCGETVTRCETDQCADCGATYCANECRCACPAGWRTA